MNQRVWSPGILCVRAQTLLRCLSCFSWPPLEACEWRAHPFSLFEPTEQESILTGKKLDLRKDSQVLSPTTLPALRDALPSILAGEGAQGFRTPWPTQRAWRKANYRSDLKSLKWGSRAMDSIYHHLKEKQAVYTNPILPTSTPITRWRQSGQVYSKQWLWCGGTSYWDHCSWSAPWCHKTKRLGHSQILQQKHSGPCFRISLWLNLTVYAEIYFLTILICLTPQ